MEKILIIYAILNVLIILYFFVYKNRQADKEYNEQLHRIRCSHSHSTGSQG